MSKKYIICALLVALLWGANFIFIKIAFDEVPPFLNLTLRFLLVSVPFLPFVKRPSVPLRQLLLLSLFHWIIHFSLVYSAIYMGISAGLSSMLMQTQAIFTLLISLLFLKIKPTANQSIGLSIAFIGLVTIAINSGSETAPVIAILMLTLAAIAFSVSNIMQSKMVEKNAFSIIVWSSLLATPPLFGLSLYFEGWDQISTCLTDISLSSCMAIAYTAIVSTTIGATMWAFLMNRLPPATVTPFLLLVPITATVLGVIVLDEVFTIFNFITSGLILIGLAINQIPKRV